ASDVKTREFDANWEVVQGTEYYVMDVSTDSSFTNLVEPYNALDVGKTTTFTVENVDPGTTYLYRVRAVSDGLTGANSQLIQTTTFPVVPEAVAATERNALKFTANWQEAAGARKYRLDVSTEASFNNILPDYNNLDVGSDLSFEVTNLEPGTSYYYRVRSEAGPRTSASSNSIEISTLTISNEQSEVSSDQLRVLANGEQSNEIRIIVKSDEGVLLEGLEVELNQENSTSEIEKKQPVTNEEGVAFFGVSSSSAGTATYTATVAGRLVGEISVEFLEDEGVLRLGNNFPNPFRSQTILPLTVPESMMVEIKVYNSIGVPVRTVVQEEMGEGYYEIPFTTNGLASGVYFYRLIMEDGIKTRKMVLVK
ncbi:MAG: Ig-like domain-containing protein, partial [Balneolaceae bacterium]|nr:Ig-like domain-containing protein [Balneolaceae bacterium]